MTVKTTHIPHIEELLFTENRKLVPKYIQTLIDIFLNGTYSSYPHLSYKWDGSMALFFGIDTETSKFFVATKTILNVKKDKNLCFGYDDIMKYHGHHLVVAHRLNYAFKYLEPLFNDKQKIGTDIFHADVLFTEDMSPLEREYDNGDVKVTITPNTVSYSYPKEKLIGKKLGIAIHTSYPANLRPAYNYTYQILPNTNEVFFENSCVIFKKDDTEAVEYMAAMLCKLHQMVSHLAEELKDPIWFTPKFRNSFWKAYNVYITKKYGLPYDDTYLQQAFDLNSVLTACSLEYSSTEFGSTILELVDVMDAFQKYKRDLIQFPKKYCVEADFHEGFIMHDNQLNTKCKIVNRHEFSQRNFRKWQNK